MARTPDLDPDLRSRIEVTGGCWHWKAAKAQGYGSYKGKRAHRIVYEQLVGAIPAGHHLHHTCRVKDCVNPAHLEPVTPGAHISDHHEYTRYDAGARRKSHRKGKETGIRIFIPAAVLRGAGIDPHGPAPEWSVWAPVRGGKPQRSLMLRFYRS